MESASSAINNLLSSLPKPGERTEEGVASSTANEPTTASTSTQKTDTTVDEEVAPAVEHTKITKEHETREQEVVENERHQDHYKTTIQPLKDSEVLPEKHEHVQQETEHRNIDHDDHKAEAAAQADRAGLQNTTEQGQTFELTTQEPTLASEHVHHHLHETVVPVIEKDIIDPSVTHKTVPIKNRYQEESQNHGLTTNKAISVGEFKSKLDGDSKATKVVEGDVATE